MNQRQVGVVQELFRYPVKSMLGERLSEFEVADNGVIGDRAWGLREANGRIASAKKWAEPVRVPRAYESPPSPDARAGAHHAARRRG